MGCRTEPSAPAHSVEAGLTPQPGSCIRVTSQQVRSILLPEVSLPLFPVCKNAPGGCTLKSSPGSQADAGGLRRLRPETESSLQPVAIHVTQARQTSGGFAADVGPQGGNQEWQLVGCLGTLGSKAFSGGNGNRVRRENQPLRTRNDAGLT